MIRLVKSTFHREAEVKKKFIDFIEKAEKLSFGKECQAFEKGFAKYQGRKHAVFFNSGSSANLALIQSLLNLDVLEKGDVVGFSALTWSTNVMPLIKLGLDPHPVDVEIDTLNVSLEQLKKAVSEAEKLDKKPLSALFLTNALGFCSDIDEIAKYCKEREILLLEDNCESLGTVYKSEKLGNFGLASTFSFYVGHHLSTIEGGMVCTDDDELANMLRIVRAHGWDRNLEKNIQDRFRKGVDVDEFYKSYLFYDLGYNIRPTDINGFLGNAQLPFIDEIVGARESNFNRFAEALLGVEKLYYPLKTNHIDTVSNFAFPLICRTKEIRDRMVSMCEGVVEVRPIIGGDVTKQPFFRKHVPGDFHNKNAHLIHEQGFYFANNPDLTDDEINKIIDTLSD